MKEQLLVDPECVLAFKVKVCDFALKHGCFLSLLPFVFLFPVIFSLSSYFSTVIFPSPRVIHLYTIYKPSTHPLIPLHTQLFLPYPHPYPPPHPQITPHIKTPSSPTLHLAPPVPYTFPHVPPLTPTIPTSIIRHFARDPRD